MEQNEEIERLNKEREIAKKIALSKWHAQKRDEDKKKKLFERAKYKADRSKKHHSLGQKDSRFKEDM